MPVKSKRVGTICALEDGIEAFIVAGTLDPVYEDALDILVPVYKALCRRRYLSRPAVYKDHALHRVTAPAGVPAPARGPVHPAEHLLTTRLSKDEFERLLHQVKDHHEFRYAGGRPQAPASLQLAVFLHRLAHGTSYSLVALAFGCSRECRPCRVPSLLIGRRVCRQGLPACIQGGLLIAFTGRPLACSWGRERRRQGRHLDPVWHPRLPRVH